MLLTPEHMITITLLKKYIISTRLDKKFFIWKETEDEKHSIYQKASKVKPPHLYHLFTVQRNWVWGGICFIKSRKLIEEGSIPFKKNNEEFFQEREHLSCIGCNLSVLQLLLYLFLLVLEPCVNKTWLYCLTANSCNREHWEGFMVGTIHLQTYKRNAVSSENRFLSLFLSRI